MAMTPTPLAFAFCEHPRQIRLPRDEVERARELLVERGILAEVVGHQDHVDRVGVERVVQAGDQASRVAGHAHEPDLALLPGARGELAPLGVLQPLDVVDRVVEVDVDVVGAEAPQALLERAHHRVATVGRARVGLRRDVDAVALAAQRPADRRLRLPAPVAVRGVEVVDAAVEGVADGVLFLRAEPASPERDVGHPQAGAAERRVAAHPDLAARLGPGPQRQRAQPEAGQRAPLQPLAPADPVVVSPVSSSSPLPAAARFRQAAAAPGPRSRRPGSRPVGVPFSSVTSPLTMVAAMPSAFCTRRRAPPGRSRLDRRHRRPDARGVEQHEVGPVAGPEQAAVGEAPGRAALSKASLRTASSSVNAPLPAHPVAQHVGLERRAHLLADVGARIRERRQRARVPEHAEHLVRDAR